MSIGNWIIKAEERGDICAVEFKKKHHWEKISWQDFVHKIIAAASQLKQKGMISKSHIGIMSATRWEWAALDLSIMGAGAVTVPLYANLSDDELVFIINHSEIKILIIEDANHQKQVARIKEKLSNPPEIISIGDIDFNQSVSAQQKEEFFKSCENIKLTDIATIVYTSGTTGTPKGAVLLHEAIVSEVTEGFELFGVKPTYKALCFLPFAHVLGRIEHWGSLFNGHCLAYAESIERVKSNLKDVKPDFLIAVPRIFEKVYSGIMAQVETNPYKQKIFTRALEISKEISKYRRTRTSIPWALLLQYETLNRLAFAPIRQAFGGNLKFAISGGAPMSSQLAEFFHGCGIPVLEGYGLTETCAAITVNTLSNFQIGTVGRPIGDVKIKFAEDGEILVKSKKCLTEYFKNPEETEKVFKDGYFATGDIGEFDEFGYLKITDRKKDLIKTAGGKYVAPQKLEGLLKQDPMISQVLIHGDQKKYIIALISLDELQVKQWAQLQKLPYTTIGDVLNHPALKLRLQKHIQNLNSTLAGFESIKKFEVVTDPWTVENGCLTQSLKVKRKVLESKYAELINDIYEG